MAGPIQIKLGTRVYFYPRIVLGMSMSISWPKCLRRENGGAIGAKRDRGGVNAVGMSIEVAQVAPRVKEAGNQGQDHSAIYVRMDAPLSPRTTETGQMPLAWDLLHSENGYYS